MTSAETIAGQIPRPAPDGDSWPYWEGVARGELRIQRCEACGRHVFYPRSICPHCHAGRLAWVTASGEGTIYSYTIVHQAFGPFADQPPFVVALVELAEGVRLMTRILGPDGSRVPDGIAIGAPVRVVFEQVAPANGEDGGEPLVLPYFRLTGS
jgi:uncharacterized OB-fold protein